MDDLNCDVILAACHIVIVWLFTEQQDRDEEAYISYGESLLSTSLLSECMAGLTKLFYTWRVVIL